MHISPFQRRPIAVFLQTVDLTGICSIPARDRRHRLLHFAQIPDDTLVLIECKLPHLDFGEGAIYSISQLEYGYGHYMYDAFRKMAVVFGLDPRILHQLILYYTRSSPRA